MCDGVQGRGQHGVSVQVRIKSSPLKMEGGLCDHVGLQKLTVDPF